MHATVRQYLHILNHDEVIKHINEEYLPMLREIPGFVSYYLVDVGTEGGRMVSVTIFEDAAGTEASNARTADWVRDNLGLIPAATAVEAGEVVVS